MEIRTQAKKADIYPNYHTLRTAKKECYPRKEATVISDSVAEVLLEPSFATVIGIRICYCHPFGG
jgi:hypothetical protein